MPGRTSSCSLVAELMSRRFLAGVDVAAGAVDVLVCGCETATLTPRMRTRAASRIRVTFLFMQFSPLKVRIELLTQDAAIQRETAGVDCLTDPTERERNRSSQMLAEKFLG